MEIAANDYTERPKKKYPPVAFKLIAAEKVFNTLVGASMDIVDEQDNYIGWVKLDYNFKSPVKDDVVNDDFSFNETPAYVVVDNVGIKEEKQGQGYGRATYDQLIDSLGEVPLRSGLLNPNSRRLWESLVRDGMAREILGEGGDDELSVIGYISVPKSQRGRAENQKPMTVDEWNAIRR